jgi:hypothetical protein
VAVFSALKNKVKAKTSAKKVAPPVKKAVAKKTAPAKKAPVAKKAAPAKKAVALLKRQHQLKRQLLQRKLNLKKYSQQKMCNRLLMQRMQYFARTRFWQNLKIVVFHQSTESLRRLTKI